MGSKATAGAASPFYWPDILRSGAALSAASALVAAPALASAQSCESLNAQRTDINVSMLKLVADYPSAHVVIGMCAASASGTYDRTHDSSQAASSFGVCAGIGCLIVGFQSCVDVTTRWFQWALQYDQIDKQMKARRCDG